MSKAMEKVYDDAWAGCVGGDLMQRFVAGVNAVHAHALRDALEVAHGFALEQIDARGSDWDLACAAIAAKIYKRLNASPGSGVPDDAEGRGRSPSTAGDPIQRGDPVSKHFPPATTSAPPQEGDDHPGPIAPLKTAAAAPSGPTETELDYTNKILTDGYDDVKNILANAIIRWKEQSK